MAESEHRKGRLRARPAERVSCKAAPVGLRALALGGAMRDGYLYVPASSQDGRPAPLTVLLHGAGEDARDGLALLREHADRVRLVLLALSSCGPTWDLIIGRERCGPDVAAIDRALEETFSRCPVDPSRVAIGGYSDGGSYALSLGVANGDLFTHVLGFSPGFMTAPFQVGFPRIFISHGRYDRWLPIQQCSRRIVPQLKRAGYEVCYQEFSGGHVVPSEIGQKAAAWITAE